MSENNKYQKTYRDKSAVSKARLNIYIELRHKKLLDEITSNGNITQSMAIGLALECYTKKDEDNRITKMFHRFFKPKD